MASETASFFFNGISIAPPPGSIMAYAGTSDPSGWLICNGRDLTAIPNATATQSQLSILKGILSSNLLPNLQNKFIMGASSDTSVKSIGGSSTVTLADSNLPAHTHILSSNATVNITSINAAVIDTTNNNKINRNNQHTIAQSGTTDDNTINNTIINIGISSISGRTDNNTTTNSSFSILPPYYTVNYIIKY
jgi:microcystin-dependent protein